VVYLYGRVKVPDGGSRREAVFQSCCVAVPNNERNLFVLPRIKPGEFAFGALVSLFLEVSIADIHLDTSRRPYYSRGR